MSDQFLSSEADHHYRLADAAQLRGDFRRAAEHYNNVLGVRPDHALSRLNLAVVEIRLGKPKDAVDKLEGLLEEVHGRWAGFRLPVLYNLAEAQAACGEYDEAVIAACELVLACTAPIGRLRRGAVARRAEGPAVVMLAMVKLANGAPFGVDRKRVPRRWNVRRAVERDRADPAALVRFARERHGTEPQTSRDLAFLEQPTAARARLAAGVDPTLTWREWTDGLAPDPRPSRDIDLPDAQPPAPGADDAAHPDTAETRRAVIVPRELPPSVRPRRLAVVFDGQPRDASWSSGCSLELARQRLPTPGSTYHALGEALGRLPQIDLVTAGSGGAVAGGLLAGAARRAREVDPAVVRRLHRRLLAEKLVAADLERALRGLPTNAELEEAGTTLLLPNPKGEGDPLELTELPRFLPAPLARATREAQGARADGLFAAAITFVLEHDAEAAHRLVRFGAGPPGVSAAGELFAAYRLRRGKASVREIFAGAPAPTWDTKALPWIPDRLDVPKAGTWGWGFAAARRVGKRRLGLAVNGGMRTRIEDQIARLDALQREVEPALRHARELRGKALYAWFEPVDVELRHAVDRMLEIGPLGIGRLETELIEEVRTQALASDDLLRLSFVERGSIGRPGRFGRDAEFLQGRLDGAAAVVELLIDECPPSRVRRCAKVLANHLLMPPYRELTEEIVPSSLAERFRTNPRSVRRLFVRAAQLDCARDELPHLSGAGALGSAEDLVRAIDRAELRD